MRVAFRCDASPATGSGHVMRCLTLADALRDAGWTCVFLCTPEAAQTVPALEDSGYGLFSPGDEAQADLLIVDHYGLDATYEQRARRWARQILVLDDLADRSHDCDILLDQTYGRDATDYRPLVPKHCRVLTGAQYALLRPQFAAMRDDALKRREKKRGQADRVLVSLGGTNLHNITSLVLEALNQFDSKPMDIDVVLRKNAPFADSVHEWCERIQARGFHRLIWHGRVENMAELMAQADLSIGAGGTTSWERCCLGLPALLINIADNQTAIAKALKSAGAVIKLDYGTVSPKQIAKNLSEICQSPERMLAMAEAASLICSGNGVSALMEEINR